MVEVKATFTFGHVAIFGNVAWSVARIFHHLLVGIYFDSTGETSE